MDIRSQRTRKNISDCFISLLNEKPASKITVTEICQLAGINRATFYKHYQDIPELLESQVEQILQQLKNFMDSHSYDKMDVMILAMLQFMRAEGARYCALGSRNGDPNLAMKTFALCYQTAFPILRRNLPDLPQDQMQMLYYYLSQGCGGVLTWWLRGGMEQPPEEVAKFILDASVSTVAGFAGKEGA